MAAKNSNDWFATGCSVQIPLVLLAVLLSPLLVSVAAARKLFGHPRLELAR